MALQLRELALFAGGGGGILGGHLLGWRTVCAVEFAPFPRAVMLARQRDGMLPAFPVWDDVRTFDGKPWHGHVDVISGGFPCQDISIAGKGDGLDGERSGLWSEMARIIGEVQPRFAFVENSPMLTSRGLDRVLGDLSTLGYDAEWGVVGADDAGAPHRRERIWILAYANGERLERAEPVRIGHGEFQRPCDQSSQHPIGQLADPDLCGRLHGQAQVQPAAGGVHAQREDVADANVTGRQAGGDYAIPKDGEMAKAASSISDRRGREKAGGENVADATGEQGGRLFERQVSTNACAGGNWGGSSAWWSTEPGLGGMADELADRLDLHGTPEPGSVPRVATGIPKRADRLKAIGNGQVPAAAALAWRTLYERIAK